MDVLHWQWILVIASSLILFFISPLSKKTSEFFSAAGKNNSQPGMFTLSASLVISWIFAKSITNAADLGNTYGFIGGFAYGCYYLSFLVCGIIIYQLRKNRFESIAHFLKSRFGKKAIRLFSLFIIFRLFNEVWSNTMVIGSYFGGADSYPYIISIVVFTVLTLAYTAKGGLKSSLLTDVIQLFLFFVLLAIILVFILPKENYDVAKFISEGDWTAGNGLNLLLVVFIQIFSYPFHDPVMTDRGFISPKKTTLKAYMLSTVVGLICISLFSFVGIYARLNQIENPAAVNVSAGLGIGMMLVMNVIMVTSAASTLDSTFSSFSKLVVVDLKLGEKTVKNGRLSMLILAVAGTLPIIFSPTILSATTISGTMVMGLAPVFLLHKYKAPKISFFLSVCCGLVFGIALALGIIPKAVPFFHGPYADLLFANIFGTISCFICYLTPMLYYKNGQN